MLTEQQRLDRMKGLGGSDIGAILGLSPYSTPYDIYASKIYLPEPENLAPDDPKNLGNQLEKEILDWYCWHNQKSLIYPPTFMHIQHPYLLANLDGLTDDRTIVVEAKSVSTDKRSEWGEEGTNQIPPHYLLQVAHYCCITQTPQAHVVVQWRDHKSSPWKAKQHSVFTYDRNAELEKVFLKESIDFWNNHVLARVPPSSKTVSDSNKKWPKPIAGASVEATLEVQEYVQRLSKIKKDIKQLESEESHCEMMIKEFMSDREHLTVEGKKLARWVLQQRTSLDTAALKKNEPEMCAKYPKTSEFRVLTLMEK